MKMLMLYILLFILITASAQGVIYSKHQSRQLFAELQRIQQAQDALHHQWTQLLLEQGTWASYSYIEHHARSNLDMVTPSPADIIVISAD